MSIFTQAIIAKIILSLTLIFLVWLGSRTVSNKIRNHQPLIDENQRRWISTTKNIAATIGFISVMMVWWPELKEFALSIAAVAVAMVIAAKELILCVSGTIFRTISRPYTIGDWIEIGNLRGEVIDQSPLSTTIQEIVNANDRYDYTGRTVVIPNSLLLNTPVKNMNFMRHYVFHS
ncbi:MAG: mechanosensitive ion channel family protein, partial [Gammaproteobacteria bacterium]|nr:mechanosensitive ion channel family protein [Gammaproteobacteria bacterium]